MVIAVSGVAWAESALIVPHVIQDRAIGRIPEPGQRLANARISCCNPRYNRIWPFDCAFHDLEIKDSEIEQAPEARLWRGTLTA
jgi:hypothetical protein